MATQQAASEPPDAITTAFVESYSHPSYAESWQAVVDYRRVQDYQAAHPEAGYTLVGSALELPPSRVRTWLDGGMPDVVRGIRTARANGWLPFDPDAETGIGLTGLCAWIYAGGSITSSHYQPLFAVDGQHERDRLHRLAELANADLTVNREHEPGRAEEYRPAEHATVLGRLLAALGCPVGEKSAASTVVLPNYLSDAPARTRQVFVMTYLDLRGERETAAGHDRLRLREDRSEQYLRSIANLFSEVLDGNVWQTGHNVVLSKPATDAYRQLESL